MKTAKTIEQLKENNEDFEWYPSTPEMLDRVKSSIKYKFTTYTTLNAYSVLDCGAGNGSALARLGGYDSFAIEKSPVLINQLDKDVVIIGTDFKTTTLIDKEVDIIFCNPPYSEYQEWVAKIITEANAKHIYLIIPQRWKTSGTIANALKLRKVEAEVIGNYDFSNAERKARAIVDIVHIKLDASCNYNNSLVTDPFDIWFDQNFTINEKPKKSKLDKEELKNAMVEGGNLIKILESLYVDEMLELSNNFTAVSKLNASILNELNVNTDSIKTALKQRIKGLKSKYWKELFNNYGVINSKLSANSLKKMLEKLGGQKSLEFTAANAYAITGWAIKNANSYYDSQLIECVENMVYEANINNYKSNHRLFKKEDWRYGGRTGVRESLVDYGLELRCILENQGGLQSSDFSMRDFVNGLGANGATTINDIVVIANNLGFKCDERVETKENWAMLNNQNFVCNDGAVLMNVKAFKNGNLHIKFNQKFIQKLNVEFGRLKGWLKNKEQAADELDIKIEDIEFGSNIKLGKSDLLMLN